MHFEASQRILQSFLETCTGSILGRTLDLFSAADFVLTAGRRVDNVATAAFLSIKTKVVCINESNYDKDGILMKFDEIQPVLLRYCFCEIERRLRRACDPGDDHSLAALVASLQINDNHLLAIRVLLSSWNPTPDRASVSIRCKCSLIYNESLI